MSLQGAGYCNGDDIFLVWAVPAIENCWGVAIWRDLDRPNQPRKSGYLENRTGFAGDPNKPHSKQPSNKWPFQRYSWTDHFVEEGDTVSYTISPVIYQPSAEDNETEKKGTLEVDRSSGVVIGPMKVTAAAKGGAAAYFNRGFLLSQFVSARLGDHIDKTDIGKMVKELKSSEAKLRQFLFGQLGNQLLTLLDEAKENRWHVYAALYELEDAQLIGKLKDLGKKAHLVLANGSTKKKGEDGNADAAAELDGVIDLNRRMLWSKGLGHNKFVVFAQPATKPLKVWTGSTNWASTGLCTQINNGILVEDAGVAAAYLKQYKLLKADVDPKTKQALFADKLTQSNDEAKDGSSKLGKWRVWFTRTHGGADLEDLTELINQANDAILFLMFEPGTAGLLQAIQARLSPASPHYNAGLYVHGVVNTLKGPDNGSAEVDLVGRGESKSFDLDVVQPEGVGKSIGQWAAEVTRRDFLKMQGGVVGFAIIHSKVIVLDPFTNPVVITGSHNFSGSASSKNDENIIVVKGNAELAQRYAVNIMGVYQHYRWRKYLLDCQRQHVSAWEGLVKSDQWQMKADDARRRESDFWLNVAAPELPKARRAKR